MKYKLSFICLLFYVATNAQDSTKQKHGLFKLSGVSTLVGVSFSTFSNGNNQTYVSKQNIASIFPEVVNKPYYNYPNFTSSNSDASGLLGVYVSFDNYSKKKHRYAIHSQTNIGVTVVGYQGLSANFTNITATRVDTLFVKQGSSYVPQYYHDRVTTNIGSLSYYSSNVGLDVQQMLTTNQKRIFSVFVGIGFAANFSTVSQISEGQSTETGINRTSQPNYNYQNYLANTPYGFYNLSNTTNTYTGTNTYNIKSSALYQAYIPFGFNIRWGKNDKKIISHFYFSTQLRIGYEIVKIQAVNAFAFSNGCTSFAIKYRF
ncbi:MAG: hypothetical protein ACYDCN_12780 [Bacteroidia bacterium]